MNAMEAMDALHRGEHIDTVTLEEWDPPAGIGIRGALILYSMQRGQAGDWGRVTSATEEVARQDIRLGWVSREEEAETEAAMTDAGEWEEVLVQARPSGLSQITVHIPTPLFHEMLGKADETGETMSQFVSRAIALLLAHE